MKRVAVAAGLWLLVSTLCAGAEDRDRYSLEPLDAEDFDRGAAAHLLRRAGFGGTPVEVDQLAELGLAAAVDHLVHYRKIRYQPDPPPIAAFLLDPPDHKKLAELSKEERRKFGEKRRKADREAFEEVRLWWLERMVESPRPLEEKMTLFWHGRFTSGMREVRNAVFMKEQNEFLRRHALDNYRELLLGIGKDRAMLIYLDGNRNRKEHPNENYARELMELFSLGVGNYTEADMKEAARAFTGWAFNRDGFWYNRRQHDYGRKRFLGKSGRFDGDDIVEIILKRPDCSRYLSRKLLEFFCRPNPEKKLVNGLAKEIRRHKYELAPVMRTLFMSRAFYSDASRGALIKSPVELVVGAARQFGVPIKNLRLAERAIANMGQEIMQPPNVKGWDGGEKWINTATLFTRYNVVAGLINGVPAPRAHKDKRRDSNTDANAGSENSMTMTATGEPKARSRIDGAAQPAIEPLKTLRARRLTDADQIVNAFTRDLLAVNLDAAKRQALVDYLGGDLERLDPRARGASTRLRRLIHLICSTPEYQMN